jgi:transcriptional regulator with PAS, ATPase and Fis domain
VLQEREVERLGENTPRKVDVRIIAATNKDLAQMVKESTFREDLYYRLKVVPMCTPTLRSRREDIPLLVYHLLSEIQSRCGQTLTMTQEAMHLLEKYDWPGNIRELANVLELAAIQADGPNILPSHFSLEIQNQSNHEESHNTPVRCYRSHIKPDEEKRLIRATLREMDGNKTSAARRLGMSRTTLWKKLKQFAII